MKIFFHRVVIIGIEVLEMKELWRGQKSKNVEIYFSTKIEKVLYEGVTKIFVEQFGNG